jgi:uncharacterized protein (TIGR00369 family)
MGDRSRTYRWEDPVGAIEDAHGLSGLEAIRKIVAGELPQPPIAETLGFRLVEADRGRAVFECEPAEFHYNPIGTVHAGLASTLLDSAMGCAFVTTLERLAGWTTLELKANFTRPLTAETGLVRCTGSVVHRGRTVATTEGRLEDMEGRLYAHGTSTILVLADRSVDLDADGRDR